MQFTLLQHWESINANHGIQVTIEDAQWKKWYDEVVRRFWKHWESDEYRVFDIDEAQECGVIWIEHLQECLNFLSK